MSTPVTATIEYEDFGDREVVSEIVLAFDWGVARAEVRLDVTSNPEHWPTEAQWHGLFGPKPCKLNVMANTDAPVTIELSGGFLMFSDTLVNQQLNGYGGVTVSARADDCREAILGMLPELEAARVQQAARVRAGTL